jgi:urease subunit alpha
MGDANASIPTPEPVLMRPMYGSLGTAAAKTSLTFVSKRCYDLQPYPNLHKPLYPIKNTRKIGKRDMQLNDVTPFVTVDAETYSVTADGEILTCEPLSVLPMSQLYFMH